MKFFKSVVQTMKDTTWLNAKETRRDTTTVVVMSIAFAVFFGVVYLPIHVQGCNLNGMYIAGGSNA